mmetsp:Transcript_5223/g.5350  ORF Transcript_5223/g.5350 Transcript_5223/m.5350 type:complete len:214 (+) Transcript_5223:1-642(+)
MNSKLQTLTTKVTELMESIPTYYSKVNNIKEQITSIKDSLLTNPSSSLSHKSEQEQIDEELKNNPEATRLIDELKYYVEEINKDNDKIQEYLESLYSLRNEDNTEEVNAIIKKVEGFIDVNNSISVYAKNFNEKTEEALFVGKQIKDMNLNMEEEISAQSSLMEKTRKTISTLQRSTVSSFQRFNQVLMQTSKCKLYFTIGLEIGIITVLALF